MFHLYKANGEYPSAILLQRRDHQMWEHMKQSVLSELGRTFANDPGAVSLVNTWPFELWIASDGEALFEMLRFRVSIEEFDQIREASKQREIARSWDHVADAMRMRGREVRYITMNIVRQKLSDRDVEFPRLFGASNDVLLALEDVQSLLENGTMPEVSAVDRLHTAIHGYLICLCDMAQLSPDPGAKVAALFSLLRQDCAEKERLAPIFRGLANVLDALSSLRNNRSLAHPSDAMLEEAEARLALNAGKTLLRYLDDRFA